MLQMERLLKPLVEELFKGRVVKGVGDEAFTQEKTLGSWMKEP